MKDDRSALTADEKQRKEKGDVFLHRLILTQFCLLDIVLLLGPFFCCPESVLMLVYTQTNTCSEGGTAMGKNALDAFRNRGAVRLSSRRNGGLRSNGDSCVEVYQWEDGIAEGCGGIQYFTWRSVRRLVQLGYLIAL